ncbi:MAG: hypothetical protein WKF81_03040, partial [Thermomicrobiales bacterium]
MKLIDAGSELARIASDLIQRHEAIETVEGRILQRLGHDWACQLLQLHGEVATVINPRGPLSTWMKLQHGIGEFEQG